MCIRDRDALRVLFDSSPEAQYLERMRRLQGEPLVDNDTGKYMAIDMSLWKGEKSPSELYNGNESDTASMQQQQKKMVHQKSYLARLHTDISPKLPKGNSLFAALKPFSLRPL